MLSESEALKYFDRKLLLGREPENTPEDTRPLGVPTAYAQEQELSIFTDSPYWPDNFTTWSLRTMGGFGSHNVYITRSGSMRQDGGYVDGFDGIRPCMWIDLATAEVEKVN